MKIVNILNMGYFPNTIRIGREAFSGCNQLSDINVQSLYTTDRFVFYGCTNLTNLILPDLKAEATYANAFQGCSNLVLSLSQNTVDEWENTMETEFNDLKEEVKEIKII